MGFLDEAKKRLTKAVDDHGDKIRDGLDKAGAALDERTGGKYADKIAKGKTAAERGLDRLDGKNDDFPKASTPTPAPPTPVPGDPTTPTDPTVPNPPPEPAPAPTTTHRDEGVADRGVPTDPGSPTG